MSVAFLDTRELATFVAIASARCQAGTLGELAEMAEMMSRSNAAAYTAQYDDLAQPSPASEIEAEALRLLAADDLLGHFGPIVYNCVTNGGTFYFGDLPADATQTSIACEVARWRKVEEEARNWQEGQRRQLERAEQNAVAFDAVGRLPMKTVAELKQLMGEGALIVAEFGVNESDSMTDYYGGRTARRVVIGIRKSKRESFPTLRKAAAAFPPTADYGPGKDVFTCHVVLTNNVKGNGYYRAGEYSHWHKDDGHGREFTTQAAAEAFIAQAGPPISMSGFDDGQIAQFEWRVDRSSLEHRENWSMGGGNYLGRSRYGGWKVRSATWFSESMEVWKL